MQDSKFPQVGELGWGGGLSSDPARREKRVLEKEFKCLPNQSKGNFIREGVMLHRQNMVTSHGQRMTVGPRPG